MTKFLSALLLFSFAATAADTGTFWVKEEGPKVSFHIASKLGEKDPDYAAMVVSMMLVTQDVTMIQADGKVQGAKVTPDPKNKEIILDFVRIESKVSRQELVNIVKDRLNKGKVQYKEVSPPKAK